nr:hypothetical protein [uncultured Dyadobacter sp.]
MGIRATLKEFLVSFRNYCFAETSNSKDENYAEGAHLQMFISIVFVYLCALPAFLFPVAFRISPLLLSYMKAYSGLKIVFAFSNLVVLGWLSLQITKKVAATPVDRTWSKDKLRQLRPIYLAFMTLGLALMFASIYLSSKIILLLDA